MRIVEGNVVLSATDLSSSFECEHKTLLDLKVARRELSRPGQSDIDRQIMAKRGEDHEARVLQHFEKQGFKICRLDRIKFGALLERPVSVTLEAMRAGYDVIYQGALAANGWVGRPDFLLRKDTTNSEGLASAHYEPLDAKLARDEKARAILQLCVYAELLEAAQGTLPERIHLAMGAHELRLVQLRTRDYLAYYRQTKARLERSVVESPAAEPYPEPVEYCDVCEWWLQCEKRRRGDDHLSFVAGVTRRQRSRLAEHGVARLVELAQLSDAASIPGINEAPLIKIRHQARLQERGRTSNKPVYELLEDFDPGCGLEALPLPKPGDLFLDLEGDAFVHEGGLEYLFGLVELGQPSNDFLPRERAGDPTYLQFWATSRAEEKLAFEQTMDRIQAGLEEFATLHVFHFGHRENVALKTLACRHATREDQVDELLRRGVLVDLHAVVKHALRASVESYSLKELEILHGFQRRVDRRASALAMQRFGWWLETREPELNPDALKETLAKYNEDDCVSTLWLRQWLEARRPELEERLGRSLARPAPPKEVPETDDNERNAETARVAKRLLAGLSDDPEDDAPEHGARRLLANLLGWHWRELKAAFWEYHQAREQPPSEWLEGRFVLAGLEYERVVSPIDRSLIHRYTFPDQEHAVGTFPGAEVAGSQAQAVNVHRLGTGYIDIKRGKNSKLSHPIALRPGRPKPSSAQERQLLAVARSIADHGFADQSRYGAAKDLLLRRPPRCGGAPGAALVGEGEDTVEAVQRLCLSLDHSVLAIQGPPGSGKTYRAAEAILALVRAGKRVGVTANSHQVILGVLDKVHQAAIRAGTPISIQHLDDPDKYADAPLPFAVGKNHADVAADLTTGALQVVGGTAFAWARSELENSVDVLIVDEASQISLANALAVSTAAKSLVLLGDPAQLEQPQKGVHPPGADVSALDHVLGDDLTMPSDRGVFLPITRRLHPDICRFTSQIFYDGRLRTMPGLEHQRIDGPAPLNGSGLRYLPIQHQGNTNRSDEECDAIVDIVTTLLSGPFGYSAEGGANPKPLTPNDILVVAPYNAQVAALRERLVATIHVGTVDKFQGKEAPIAIYSMTTSSGDDAPRGLEFLYSLNRLNVATSRAKALVILVASPELTKARCRSPRQLKLVNALCAYLEAAEVLPERR